MEAPAAADPGAAAGDGRGSGTMNRELLMQSRSSTTIAGKTWLGFLMAAALLSAPAALALAAAQGNQNPPAAKLAQRRFASPDEAAKAAPASGGEEVERVF